MAIVVMLLTTISFAAGQGTWELRICADPANAPMSTSNLEGFENQIASILAEELGAEVTYVWTLISDATIRDLMKRGACDVVMSAGEGASDLLNTVAYYRVPQAFLYLADSGIAIQSLYDPVLAELRIGAMPNTSTHAVLLDLELGQNYVGIQPNVAARGPDRIGPSVNALREGRIDVAIVSGAYASVYAQSQPEEFAMTPVQPELYPPLTPMFHMATIGVRPRDEGLRDALNLALAQRWDDVQEVFAELGIPTLPSTPVLASEAPSLTKIGVIAPFATGFPAILDEVAESVYQGARVADDLVWRGEGRESLELKLIYASAPSVDAAERAYDRLVRLDEVSAIVVAMDDDATRRVAERAARDGVVVLNVLSGDDGLRSKACYPTTFHVAPSNSLGVQAMVAQAIMFAPSSILAVGDGSPASMASTEFAVTSSIESGVSARAVVLSRGPLFTVEDVATITQSGAEAVLLFLDPPAQELLMSELNREDFDAAVIGFPSPVAQTREFYYRLVQDSAGMLDTPRIAGWDSALTEEGAAELNLRYSSRSARAMDVSGWATYAAIELAVAALVKSELDGSDMSMSMDWAAANGNLFKRGPLYFEPDTNQLLQPQYLVQIDPEATWSQAVSQRVGIAEVVDTLSISSSLQRPDREPATCQ